LVFDSSQSSARSTVVVSRSKEQSQAKEKYSMSETSTLIGYSGRTIGREELALVATPPATETHRPIPHHEIVRALIETLGFRHIGVVHDEYAVSQDGMKMFGVLDLATEMNGCRFSIGLRNSHDKSMRLAMTCGYRVFVCSNMAFSGDFTPVLAKHSKSFELIDCVSVGVDRMQRNFEPMRKQVETWQRSELTDVAAKVVIYEAFVEGRLEAPKHLARTVHDLYFEPKYEEFTSRQSGVSRTRSPPHSRNSNPSHSSGPLRSWVNSWRPDSRRRSELRLAVPAGPRSLPIMVLRIGRVPRQGADPSHEDQ
jgi:Domain of unknown function (DUF932)